MSTNYAAAMRGYRDEIAAAMNAHDPNLSDQGNADRQRTALAAARARLLAARPPLPSALTSRDDVLASLAPRTRDDIARLQHEQSKIRALLDKGYPLGWIIAEASAERALAVADLIETLPQVLESSRGAEIIAETRGYVFDRLADLGVESAAKAREVEQRNAPALAWHRAMTEAAEGSDATIAAWQDVYRADPEGYDVARADLDGSVDEWLRRHDLAEKQRVD